MPPRLPARVIFLKIHHWNCYFCICKELGFLSQNKCVTFQIPVSKIFVLLFSSSLLIGFNNNHKKKYTRYGANFFFLSEKYHAVAVASQPLTISVRPDTDVVSPRRPFRNNLHRNCLYVLDETWAARVNGI